MGQQQQKIYLGIILSIDLNDMETQIILLGRSEVCSCRIQRNTNLYRTS